MNWKATLSAGLVGLVGLTGCISLDEEIVSGVTASYLETPAGLEDAVDAAYSFLQSHYGQERNMTMLEYGTDLWAKGADGSHKQWNDYTAQLEPRTAYARDQWNASYQGINVANAAINRAANITGMPEATKAQRVAEARFLRGFFYFYLVRHYGDVHITTEETQGVVTEASRSPVAQVYSEVIIPDLEAAIAALPATQTGSNYGRITGGAAQHLLGLVYLTRLDAGDAARAEPLLRAVATSSVYSLEPRYVDLFCQARSPAVPCTVPTNERKPEVVFSIQSTPDPLTAGQGNRWHLYFLMQYDTRTGMTRTTTYGRPFKRLRPTQYLLDLHNEAIDSRFQDSFQFVWLANKGDAAAGLAIGDTAIFLPNVKTSQLPDVYKGKKYAVATEPDNFWSPRIKPFPQFPNVLTEYGTDVFPSMIKHHDPNRASTNEERSERDFVVYRLADTYLLLAESLIRQGKQAEAVQWVNRVRERAAKPGQQAAMRVGVESMNLDFILEERGRELFGEGHRWFDLKRFGKLVEMKALHDLEARPNIKPFHVLRPIPQDQIDRTKNADGSAFGQNPGY